MSGAVFEGGKLQEVFLEDVDSITGNVYLGRVTKIIEGLDGAFVDIGQSRNAFLRLKDVGKRYLREVLGKDRIEEGDKVIVQVRKDATRTKGPQVTAKISLVGRYVVYFPLNFAKGVSRRITDDKERKRLKSVLRKLRKRGEGLIIRTASEGVDEEVIEKDLDTLRSIWEDLLKRFRRSRKPKLLLKEPDVLETIIRDRVNRDVEKLVTNDVEIADRVKKVMGVYGKTVEIEYVDGDVFEVYGVYSEIEKLSGRVVRLENGAYIVIERTEAMTVIDVNSASFTEEPSHRELVLRTNIEAAREIARQLRLRNIGGIIVIDFITMESEEDRKKVMEELIEALRKDRARTEVLGFTKLGLLEMTRRRTSRSIDSMFLSPCPVCGGSGRVVSPSIVFRRILEDLKSVNGVKKADLRVHRVMSGFFNRESVSRLRMETGKEITVSFDWCDPKSYELKFSR